MPFVTIEKIVAGAYGLAHHEGETLLIRNALPGEVVDYEVLEERGGVKLSEAKTIYEEAPIRVEPVCLLYGRCGGCDFQIVGKYDSAILKTEIVKEALLRTARLGYVPYFDESESSPFLGHRTRCRFHYEISMRLVGFMEENSNELVPVNYCPALDEALNSVLADDKRLFSAAREKMMNGEKKRGRYFQIEGLSNGREVSLDGKPILFDVLGHRIEASSELFFQSNLEMLPKLAAYVLSNTIGETIMDLYSGVGTFASLFEGSGKRVYAVERDRLALSFMKKNAPSAVVFTEDVLTWGKKSGRHADTIILDPPRVGLGRDTSKLIASWRPERIIYVSCDAVTMARDIAHMEGYIVEKVKVFDFYPGTHHTESVTILKRKN